jgi:hypothetical protein
MEWMGDEMGLTMIAMHHGMDGMAWHMADME